MNISPPKCIAVDVDGTLIDGRHVNARLVESLKAKASDGYDIVIWSMRGRAYAQAAADHVGLADVAVCISKPGVVVDDRGLEWLRGCRVVRC